MRLVMWCFGLGIQGSRPTSLTKYHKLGSLHNRNGFSHGSGDWKSEIKVLAGLVSSEASLLGLEMTIFFLCPHTVFPLCSLISVP